MPPGVDVAVVTRGQQHGVGGAPSVVSAHRRAADEAAVDDEQRPGRQDDRADVYVDVDVGGGFVDDDEFVAADDAAGEGDVAGAADEHVFGDRGCVVVERVVVFEPFAVKAPGRGRSVHDHHAAGVVERDHQRRGQVGEATADDVAEGLLGAQKRREPLFFGRRRRFGMKARRQRPQRLIGGAAGQVGAERSETCPHLEGLLAKGAVVAGDDDAAQVEGLHRRQHTLERPQVAVDVGEAEQGASCCFHMRSDVVRQEGTPAVHLPAIVQADTWCGNEAREEDDEGAEAAVDAGDCASDGAVDVLVVDPGELGELLSTLLTQYGLSAARVQTGEQALGIALDAKPSVVVVEAELPDTSGLDLAELLQTELGARVVLTHAPGLPHADANTAARVRALDAAFARPFRSLALIETVARLAEKPLVRPGGAGPVEALDAPLSSTEGLPIEELADLIDIPFDDDEHEARVVAPPLKDDEVSFAGLADSGLPRPARPEVDPPELLLEQIAADEFDETTVPSTQPKTASALSSAPTSQEAARPLEEVLAEEARQKQQGAFSPGELAELWKRVKARRSSASTRPSDPDPEGLLSPRALADLLDAFHQSLTTGELWLDHDAPNSAGGKRVLLLKRGVLAGARSNLVGEDLLSQLKKKKVLDDDDAAEVETLVKTGTFKTAADAVVGLDLVDAKALVPHVEEQVRRVAIGAFGWSHGRYRLTLEGRAAKEPVPAQVFVGDAIVHAMLLTETDDALAAAAPDDARFAPSTDGAYGLEHLMLSPQEARIVIAMDGTKTIADLVTLFAPPPPAPQAPRDPLATAQRANITRLVRGLAAGLFCLHLLRFVGHGPASARKISFF